MRVERNEVEGRELRLPDVGSQDEVGRRSGGGEVSSGAMIDAPHPTPLPERGFRSRLAVRQAVASASRAVRCAYGGRLPIGFQPTGDVET